MNIPRSAARSMIRHEQKRQVRAAMRGTATGEKIMGALMPGRGYAFPGGWSQDRIAQIQHMKNWVGVCIDKLASLCAQLVPNVAYVSNDPPKTQKGWSPYRQQLDGLASGARRLQRYDCAGYNFSIHPYHAKALGVLKPNEHIEPVEANHPLRRLIENPNDWDIQYDHDYELIMFQYLCGVGYDWAVPVDYHWEDNEEYSTPVAHGPFKGYPGELWCLPSHWVWPRSSGGQLVSRDHPNADKLIEYYEVRPWGGLGTAGVIRIPPEQIIRYAFKSPINKVDGYARTEMGRFWIDTDDSIATCQRSMMTNGVWPSFWLEMGEGFADLTDDQVDRVEAKIYSKLGGENRFGRPFISSQGTKPHPLVFPPNQYAFADSGDQSRNRIISLFGLNLPVLGLSEDQTFGSVLANLMSVSVHTLKPLLTANGQTKTKFLARYFSTPQRPLKVWYDDPTPIDPEQLNKDLACDLANASITPNEQRAIRGRPAYEHGGDDPMVSGPGGLIPFPMSTGTDLSGLADLVPLLGRQENPAAEEEEAEAGLGSPQVEEPNGKPGKSKKSLNKGRWITMNDAHIYLDDSGKVAAGPERLMGQDLNKPESAVPGKKPKKPDKPNTLSSEGAAKLRENVEDIADRHIAHYGVGIAMHDLYHQLRQRDPNFSKDDLKKLVRQLHDDNRFRLSGWGRTYNDLPDPELATFVGGSGQDPNRPIRQAPDQDREGKLMWYLSPSPKLNSSGHYEKPELLSKPKVPLLPQRVGDEEPNSKPTKSKKHFGPRSALPVFSTNGAHK